MKIETGYQPNCSEVVFNIGDMTKEEVLEILKRHGIHEIETNSERHDNVEYLILSDDDNPNIPDFIGHASLGVEEEYEGSVHHIGTSIIGSQHCQTQMFPTMKKIEEAFEYGQWIPDDGGNVIEYETWLEEGAKEEKGFQLGLVFYIHHLSQKKADEIKQYVYDEFGLKCKSEDNEHLDFGDIPASLISILPADVGSKREPIIANEVRAQIKKKIKELTENR